MTIWTTAPAGELAPSGTRLLRVRPGKPITGIVTSRAMLGCNVHYWRGRTTPCEEDRCPACKDHRMPRWYGWLGLWNPRTHEHVIAEITSACVEPVSAYALKHGTLRGSLITLERATPKLNARLAARITESAFSPDALPDELDVIHVLEKIWETHRQPHTDAPAHNDDDDQRPRLMA